MAYNPNRLRATCKILIDGKDVTDKFDPHLLDVTITDKEYDIDEANIRLDDRYGRLQLPTDSSRIEIRLGWPNEGDFKSFEGTLYDLTSRGQRRSGRVLVLEARALNLLAQGKMQKNDSWGEGEGGAKVKVGDVLTQAAGKAGILLSIDPEIAAKTYDYIAQNGESFLAFAKRIAEQNGGQFKVQGGFGAITKTDGFTNAKGEAMPTIQAKVGRNVIGWAIKPKAARPQWKSVGFPHFDPKLAKWLTKTKDVAKGLGNFFGGATAIFTGGAAPSESAAENQAAAGAAVSLRERGKGWIVIDGEPQAQPGGKLVLTGAREGVDGEYKITEVEHSYVRGGGFTTRCDVNQPTPTFVNKPELGGP